MALGLAAAHWQLSRAHEKEALAARLESRGGAPAVELAGSEAGAGDLEWRHVTVSGRFDPAHAVFIDNRIRRGVAGFHVVMPLEIGEKRGGPARYVLVNRGWIAGVPDRSRLPDVATPDTAVRVSG